MGAFFIYHALTELYFCNPGNPTYFLTSYSMTKLYFAAALLLALPGAART